MSLMKLSNFAISIALVAAPAINVSPQTSMVDEPLAIAVTARPHSHATVTLTTERFGLRFQSAASYVVPESGSLRVDPSLLWLMMPTGPSGRPATFERDSDLAARTYAVSVAAGGVTASSTFVRQVLDDRTARTVVDSGTLVATLFSAKDGTCRPGAIVLGGSEGGVPEEEAAILASRGFATLALAYFNAPGLSRNLVNVPVELVGNAVAFLRGNPAVCKDRGIGVLGSSKGAELALVSASLFPQIRAVVAISPASVIFGGIGQASNGTASSWSYEGKPLPFANGVVPPAVSNAIAAERSSGKKISYLPEYTAEIDGNTDAAAVIQVDRIRGPLLLVAGGDDRLWPSLRMANQIAAMRKKMTPRDADVVLSYPSAGHPIGLPFGFAKAELAHSSLDLGGTAEANEAASENSWPKIVAFLKKSL
jgi:dienelactone hydrolase